MALRLRKAEIQRIQNAIVFELNRQRDANVAANFHASRTQVAADAGETPQAAALGFSVAVPTDLPTSILSVNEMFGVVNTHFQDSMAHNTAVTPAITLAAAPVAVDLPSVIVRANAIKAAYNTGGHINTANVHFTNDATNVIAAANATDLASSIALLTALRSGVLAHMNSALVGNHIEIVDS